MHDGPLLDEPINLDFSHAWLLHETSVLAEGGDATALGYLGISHERSCVRRHG